MTAQVIQVVTDSTPIWIPFVSVVGALIGGIAGVQLKNLFGHHHWLREIRLRNYVAFVDECHVFHQKVHALFRASHAKKAETEILVLRDELSPQWLEVTTASSGVAAVGPKETAELASNVTAAIETIVFDLDSFDKIAQSAEASMRRQPPQYQPLINFSAKAMGFETAVRAGIEDHLNEARQTKLNQSRDSVPKVPNGDSPYGQRNLRMSPPKKPPNVAS